MSQVKCKHCNGEGVKKSLAIPCENCEGRGHILILTAKDEARILFQCHYKETTVLHPDNKIKYAKIHAKITVNNMLRMFLDSKEHLENVLKEIDLI